MLFINHVKIVKMIVLKFCIKTQRTQRTAPPISTFFAIACLHSQLDSVARVLISTKSAKGCREVNWIVNSWLARLIRDIQYSVYFEDGTCSLFKSHFSWYSKDYLCA